MAVGKSCILVLVTTSIARADTYSSPSPVSELLTPSFGWFKKLDDQQLDSYNSSIIHALEFAELGHRVKWYSNNASGFAESVAEWPNTSGYCRRLHIQTIAFDQRKTMSVTACNNSMTELWTWYMGKY